VEGVVTAAFLGQDALDGVFLQDPRGDDDPATSDALFVRLRSRVDDDGRAPRPGDLLRVQGRVLERNAMTQLDHLGLALVCGRAPVPGPAPLPLPLTSTLAPEALEGMLVHPVESLTITEVYDLGRYGHLELADGRLFVATQGAPTGGSPNDLRRLTLDDASGREDPRPVPFLMPDGTPPRVGDAVDDLTAVVWSEGVGSYALQPVRPPVLRRANARPPAPDPVGGDLRVATFNVHNFFSTLSDRGAASAEELDLQRSKLANALVTLDADVIALEEVENNGMRAENDLVAALNQRLGAPVYAAVPDPASGVGSDRIKQALLYRPAVLELKGSASDPARIHDRPPIAATFRRARDGSVFSVIAAHLKSKGGCPPAGDSDLGFGCWNLRRSAQAQALIDFAARIAASTQDPDVLVVGDLNSYLTEPPLRLFTRAGFLNVDLKVRSAERYSYVYFGESGTLDYALASRSLADQVTGATFWHINADESTLLDADTRYDPPALVDPGPYRSSDHDPLLVGLALR
jgi:predicted extracellular nuclease